MDLGSEHAVGFRWEGDFDEKAFKESMVQFLPEFKSRNEMNIYMEISGIGEVEGSAVWEDAKFAINNLKELADKVDKIALVTNESWMRNMAEASYKMIPGIKLKAFTSEEKTAAKEWVV
ncbi:STAS/SEC14 domain-containing protein [Zunongwangia sp. F260]|uniref:STAS/SEC14 domain-containing protein n=1 Tax=Autumnicola lenta TaxID=3075593 RepID=A0ABU3CN09_9FLAO|nr:STAS/SEC14 domain-containing protein [Zunongwangia sp. F260]MDT0647622.1 STAS/SEC14 domain-containing protein [Zunongwangia sp. F260]